MNARIPSRARSDLDPRLIAGTAPLPISLLFRTAVGSSGKMLLLFGNGRLCRSSADGAEVGDYKTLPWTENGKVPCMGPAAFSYCRHVPAVGRACCWRARSRQQHRLPAASLDLCLNGHVAGRAGLRSHARLCAAEVRRAGLHGLLSKGQRAAAADLARFSACGDYDFSNFVFDGCWSRNVRSLEKLSRDLSRALSRPKRAPGPAEMGRFRQLRVGLRAHWS